MSPASLCLPHRSCAIHMKEKFLAQQAKCSHTGSPLTDLLVSTVDIYQEAN